MAKGQIRGNREPKKPKQPPKAPPIPVAGSGAASSKGGAQSDPKKK